MISLLTPSRGRPQRFSQMAQSAILTSEGGIEIVLGLDADDPTKGDYPQAHCIKTVVFDIEAREDMSLTARFNHLAQLATGRNLLMMADDVIVRTDGWDTALAAAMPDDGIGVVYPHDGAGGQCVNPMISRKWLKIAGQFTTDAVEHWYCDQWLEFIAIDIYRAFSVGGVLFEHMHPLWDKAPMDETYAAKLKPESIKRDKAIFDGLIRERRLIAEKLREAMEGE